VKKVRFLVGIAGHAMPQYGLGEFAFQPGDVADLDETLASHWLAAGHVEKVADENGDEPNRPAQEQTAKQAPKKTAKGKGRR
jgi:hypothetical protein